MLSIAIPTNVKVTWGDSYIKVEGPLGILVKKRGDFNLAVKDNKLFVWEENASVVSEGKIHVFLNDCLFNGRCIKRISSKIKISRGRF